MGKTAACIKIIQLLSCRDVVSTNELADLLETNPRNIKEYIKEIQLLGYNIESYKGIWQYLLENETAIKGRKGANLRGANLDGAYFYGANLSETNLSGADLKGANLKGANLSYANLSEANLERAKLEGADFSGANLTKANLNNTNLVNSNKKTNVER